MPPVASASRRHEVWPLVRLARAALAAWGIADARLARLTQGWNTTFRLDRPGGDRYVLRIHGGNGHDVAEVRSELLWLAALRRDTDLSVPEPVPSGDGALVVLAATPELPAPRPCVLLRWLPGRFLDAALTPARLEQVGVVMARLQAHAAGWTPPAGFTRPAVDSVTLFARAQADPWSEAVVAQAAEMVVGLCGPDDGALVAAAIRQVRAVRQALGPAPAVYGLIHADLHQENYLFDRGAPRVIDFDDCGYGPYLFDLAVTLRELQHLAHYPALRAGLLAGYRSVRALPAAHEAHLPAFFALRRLQLLLWILEHRDAPRFRATWAAEVRYDLGQLRGELAQC